MKHFHVTGGLIAAQAISAAVWRVCLPPGSVADTAFAIGWRETQGGVLLDFPEDYEVKLLNLAAAKDVLTLVAPASSQSEINALAAGLIQHVGESLPILSLLPQSIQSALVDSSDLIDLGFSPVEGPR